MSKKPNAPRVRAVCPECGATISFEDELEVDDEVICPECDTLLVVAGNKPLRFEVAEEFDYDYEDDEEWDDEEEGDYDDEDEDWEDEEDEEDDDRY